MVSSPWAASSPRVKDQSFLDPSSGVAALRRDWLIGPSCLPVSCPCSPVRPRAVRVLPIAGGEEVPFLLAKQRLFCASHNAPKSMIMNRQAPASGLPAEIVHDEFLVSGVEPETRRQIELGFSVSSPRHLCYQAIPRQVRCLLPTEVKILEVLGLRGSRLRDPGNFARCLKSKAARCFTNHGQCGGGGHRYNSMPTENPTGKVLKGRVATRRDVAESVEQHQ